MEEDSQIVEAENTDHAAGFGMGYRPAEGVSMTMNYSIRLRRPVGASSICATRSTAPAPQATGTGT